MQGRAQHVGSGRPGRAAGMLSSCRYRRPIPATDAAGSGASPKVITPMIAREEYLASLQRAYLGVSEDAGSRAVIITADAGVGKSRVLREFTRWLAAGPQPPTVLSADAGPRSAHQPFGLIRDAIANLVGISESDPIERARHRPRHHVAPQCRCPYVGAAFVAHPWAALRMPSSGSSPASSDRRARSTIVRQMSVPLANHSISSTELGVVRSRRSTAAGSSGNGQDSLASASVC